MFSLGVDLFQGKARLYTVNLNDDLKFHVLEFTKRIHPLNVLSVVLA